MLKLKCPILSLKNLKFNKKIVFALAIVLIILIAGAFFWWWKFYDFTFKNKLIVG